MQVQKIDGVTFQGMLEGGAANLRLHAREVNELNVFPIPDGDTGDNMLMTMEGGTGIDVEEDCILADAAKQITDGMLLGARGNSGVILSQFFAGIAEGFGDVSTADVRDMELAFQKGVERAYDSVMVPTEGTILTVAKDATNAACEAHCETVEEFFYRFVTEAKRSLDHTPELLDVLKEADVVDSGGAGLVYITEGMYGYIKGDMPAEAEYKTKATANIINPALFTEDTKFEFGYCTELLLRLQNAKTDVKNFDANVIRSYLETIGNSIVCVKNDSIIKIHVHTFEPYKVLEYCQRYGEYLTVKIENMMLQHNENEEAKREEKKSKPRKKAAVVTVASGEGIKETFLNFGADAVILGGQTMNPSSADFIEAFNEVNADVIYVLPNNSNIILAAEQAAKLYDLSKVYVIPTKTIGHAYAVLSMLDIDVNDPDGTVEAMMDSMEGVVTAEVSKSIRDAKLNGKNIKEGEYLGIIGKEICDNSKDIINCAVNTSENMELDEHGVLMIIAGKDAKEEETSKIEESIKKAHPFTEVAVSLGGQDVYPYLLIAE